MLPKIKITGFGYVGTKAYQMLKDFALITIFDKFKQEHSAVTNGEVFDFEFVCVPTNSLADGSCDTSNVTQAVASSTAEILVVKSTVPPTTCAGLAEKYKKRIVFNPEYVGESSYDTSFSFHTDMKKTPFVVLGGEMPDVLKVYDLLLPIVGCEKKFHLMTSTEAELVKYMENTFFATKITFCNQMYDFAQAFGCNWERVRQGWIADPRINPMHTAVFKNKRGFSGRCLPKDTRAFVRAAELSGIDARLLTAVMRINDDYQTKKEE